MVEVPTHEEERVDEEGVVVPRRRNRVVNRLVKQTGEQYRFCFRSQ